MQPILVNYSRVSSTKQVKGTSLKTQTDSEKLADVSDKLGLPISNRIYQDKGRSAYHGKHLFGALGQALDDIRTGVIPKGSCLAVYNLDRLSREDVNIALAQFLNILNQGVNIYTLIDDKFFTVKDNPNISVDLILSLLTMQRAYEESATKSNRAKAAIAEGVKTFQETGVVKKSFVKSPMFIDAKTRKLNDFAPYFIKIVNLILEGKSDYYIVKELNANSDHIWTTTTITTVRKAPLYLTGDRIIKVDGKEELLKGFYEPLIDIRTYNNLRLNSPVKRTGKKDRDYLFLLTGVYRCKLCDSSMVGYWKGDRYKCSCRKSMKGEATHPKVCFDLQLIETVVCTLMYDHIEDAKKIALNGKSEAALLQDEIIEAQSKVDLINAKLKENFGASMLDLLHTYEMELKTLQNKLQEVLIKEGYRTTPVELEWLKSCLSSFKGGSERAELRGIILSFIDTILIDAVEWDNALINRIEGLANKRGLSQPLYKGKGYSTIRIKVRFKDGDERSLFVSRVSESLDIHITVTASNKPKHLSIHTLKQLVDSEIVRFFVISKARLQGLRLN
ncbi:TPA: recombinase family protein [Vibrio vulnificus]|nr:hypothetical protein [Vibrio vulnificus]